MSYRDYQDVDTGKLVDGSGKQKLENIEVVHNHVYDDEGRCKSGDFAYAHARIVNSPNAEVDRFYEDFEEALSAALLPENAGCTLELWWENPNANEKNGGAGYLINSGKFTLDLRDRCMEHDFVTDAPEYVLKHTGGELTLTASGGYEMGMLRAYGPVKALGIDGGHVRIDDGRYMWIWHKDYDNEDNSGCIVELRSGELEIGGGTFSSDFKDETPDEDTQDPKIRLIDGSLTVTGEPVFEAAIEIAADFTANGGKISLSGGTFSKLVSKDTALTVADMLAPCYVCRDADGDQMSLADLSTKTELENFSVVKCEHGLKENGGKYICPYCNAELTVSAMQIPGGKPYYYTDLASALEGSAQLSGQVLLTLLTDVEIAEQVCVTEESYTLDLSGRTLTCKASGGNIVDASAILVSGGELTVKDDAGGGKVGISANQGVGLCAVGGTLTIESGTYTADRASSIVIALGGDGTGEAGTNGTVILTGGEFSPNGEGSEAVHVGNDRMNGGKALIVSGNVTVKSTSADTYYGVRIDSAYKGTVSMSAGTFSKINIEAEGMTAADLLADGFQFRNSSRRWITDLTVTQLTRTSVAAIPIRLGEMKDSYDMVYKAEGKNVITLEVFASESGEGFEEYDLFLEFECEDENGNRGNGSTSWADIDPDKKRAVFTLDGFLRDKAVGAYRFTVTSVKYHSSQLDEYKLPGKSFTVNVLRSGTKATVETGITDTWFDRKDTFTYGQRITVRALFNATGELPATLAMTPPGENQCAVFNADGEQISEAEYEQSSGTWWLDIPGTALDVGTHELTVKYFGGKNQTGMSVPFTVTVVPRPITALVQDETPLVYNGTPLTRSVASVEADGIPLTTADYDMSGNTQTTAGTYELTVTGKGNFTGTLTGSYTIGKATAPTAEAGALTVYNQTKRTYEVDLAGLLPELGDSKTYGTVGGTVTAVTLSEGYYDNGAAIENGKLILPIESVSGTTTGKIGTVTVNVETTNYEDFTLSIDVSAENRPSSGGSGGSTTYPVNTPGKTENGSVTVSTKNTAKGSTVTVTVKPDDGYRLDALTVTDGNGDPLQLTDKGDGRYTFIMPAGKVEVSAVFVKEAETSPFSDVSTDAYYYNAVKWAADKGITSGIGNGLFSPDSPCTRAQIVTFLWRAAGSPEPKAISSFSDVPAGSYYAKAVAWAIENGITTGIGGGKFSPDATCTRAQSVTFLFRTVGASADGAPAFTDVTVDAYYAEAVKWAADHGITNGIGNSLFGPNNACMRAQIVTFLWKLYASK